MEQHFDAIAALAYRYVPSRDLARDIAQETFIKLWEHRQQLALDTTLRAYLSRVARNRAIDTLRHDTRTASLEQRLTGEYADASSSNVNLGEGEVERDEFHRLVHAVAATLTPRVREVLLLYFDDQLDPTEIAAVLGVAPKTVYAQLRTALRIYADALAGRWP